MTIENKNETDIIAEFQQLCARHGLKATHQRIEIYKELAKDPNHPSAEIIYKRVLKRMPTLSFDTVYRTLRILEEKGVISRVGANIERQRFDANTKQHHHFICEKCGLIMDFYSEDLNNIKPPNDIYRIGKINVVQIEARGICLQCEKR